MPDSTLTLAHARTICAMEAVCYSEGIGPDSDELMATVFALYPELRAEFSWLPSAKEPAAV